MEIEMRKPVRMIRLYFSFSFCDEKSIEGEERSRGRTKEEGISPLLLPFSSSLRKDESPQAIRTFHP